jgi:HK97 family phage major capsid protein
VDTPLDVLSPFQLERWHEVYNAVETQTGDANAAKSAAWLATGKLQMVPTKLAARPKFSIGGPMKRTSRAAKAPQGAIEGYLITFGGPQDTDLERQFFSPETQFHLDWFDRHPALYHHGLDSQVGLGPIGYIKSYQADDLGLWVQAQLEMHDKYAQAVYDMIQARDFGWSSGSVEHLVQVDPNGLIRRWPVIEGSATPTPAQVAKTTIYPVNMSTKAISTLLGERNSFANNLRGLSAREGSIQTRPYNSLKSLRGDDNMEPRTKSPHRRLVAAIFREAGIKANPDEIEEVAGAVNADVDDELATMMEDELETTMVDMDDEALTALDEDEDEALAAYSIEDEDEDALAAYLTEDEDEDEALAAYLTEDEDEDEALAAFLTVDDEDEMTMTSTMPADDVISSPPVRHVRRGRRPRRARGKSLAVKQANPEMGALFNEMRQMRRQIKTLSLQEAPGQRSVGRGAVKGLDLQVVNDPERLDAQYLVAYKSYIRFGRDGVDPDEMRLLNGRGRVNFEGADSEYNPATKTLYGKVVTSGTDSGIGYSVPPQWLEGLNKHTMSATVMAPECDTKTTTSDRLLQSTLRTTDARRAHSGAAVSYPGEVTALAQHQDADLTVQQIAIPVHIVLISLPVSLSSLEDAHFDLQQEITLRFAEAAAVSYDTNIWSGDGQGKMAGIVNDVEVITNRSTGEASVSGYVTAGSTTDIDPDQIIAMTGHFPAVYDNGSKFYCNKNTLLHIRQLKDGDGRYLWDAHGTGISGGMPKELLGVPVVVNSFASDIAANSFPLMLANLKSGYTIAQRVDFSIRRFDEVRAVSDEVLFIGRARLGGQVTRPEAVKVLKMSTS